MVYFFVLDQFNGSLGSSELYQGQSLQVINAEANDRTAVG
jgi:hypothetical protein